jgi:hypothetical protein
MGKRPEDEIQKKLMELEISIKDEESKKQLPAASQGSKALSTTGNETSSRAVTPVSAESKMETALYKLAGYGLGASGILIFLSHITIYYHAGMMWGMGWAAPSMGFLVLPLLLGIGMLFYSYKSRVAQLVTLGGFALIILTILGGLSLTFTPLSLLDFVFMSAPLLAGAVLIIKAHEKQKACEESTKLIK